MSAIAEATYSGGKRELKIIRDMSTVFQPGVDALVQKLFIPIDIFRDAEPKTEELHSLLAILSPLLGIVRLTGVEQII
jgi:hypothetical protein